MSAKIEKGQIKGKAEKNADLKSKDVKGLNA